MDRLGSKYNLISLYENEKLTYSFNWEILGETWNYATLDDVEGIRANYKSGFMSIILTTANGQSGIVVIVNTVSNRIIHYHDGSLAIETLIAGDRLITLYHVISFGNKPAYYVDCMCIDHMRMIETDDNIKLPENLDFNDEKIVMTLVGKTLTIEDGTERIDIDISSLI